jgi:hypothetical protein
MPWFLTRVELSGATKANLTLLNAEMKKRGFTQSFSADGAERTLPANEYFCDTGNAWDAVQESGIVRDRAKAAVGAAWKKGAAIVVVRYDQIAWDGLAAAAAPAAPLALAAKAK